MLDQPVAPDLAPAALLQARRAAAHHGGAVDGAHLLHHLLAVSRASSHGAFPSGTAGLL